MVMWRYGLVSALLTLGVGRVSCDYRVKFDIETDVGNGSFVVNVHDEWAPHGASQFQKLVAAHFYDDTRFFRVIPTFMVQFGLSGDPKISAAWRSKTIPDDPVKLSNQVGYVTFAKTGAPNSRTTQLFINYVDNARLDSQGFAPFGLVEDGGMAVVKQIYDVGQRPSQSQIQRSGNAYLDVSFPQISKLVRATILAPK